MSRGGIGKSKKQPPPPPPKKRGRSRERTPREARQRPEQKPRPGLAAGVGSIMLGLSTVVIFIGLVLTADDQDGGQSALSLGLATLPMGHATVAMLSRREPIIGSTLIAFLITVAVGTGVLTLLALLGIVAYFTAMTLGVGIGGLASFRQPPESPRSGRLKAIGIVATAILIAEAVGFVPAALLGPFVVIGAMNYVDNRAVLASAAGAS